MAICSAVCDRANATISTALTASSDACSRSSTAIRSIRTASGTDSAGSLVADQPHVARSGCPAAAASQHRARPFRPPRSPVLLTYLHARAEPLTLLRTRIRTLPTRARRARRTSSLPRHGVEPGLGVGVRPLTNRVGQPQELGRPIERKPLAVPPHQGAGADVVPTHWIASRAAFKIASIPFSSWLPVITNLSRESAATTRSPSGARVWLRFRGADETDR